MREIFERLIKKVRAKDVTVLIYSEADEIVNHVANIEMEVAYLRAVVDGSWPSAQEVIDYARSKKVDAT
jgi:acetyl/propionyl-CoA carboxylase alpha subunit